MVNENINQNSSSQQPEDEFRKAALDPSFGNGVSYTPKAVKVVYLLIFLYGLAVAYFYGTHFWEMYLWYIGGLIGFFCWHILAHQKWTGAMHKYHMYHHIYLYPPKYFFGNPKAKDSEKAYRWVDYIPLIRPESFFHELPLYIIGGGIVYLGYLLGASKASIIFGTIELSFVGLVGNYFHNSFHIKGHWLEQFEWYHEIRALHYIHHKGAMNQNFAILNFRIDKILHLFVDDYGKEQILNDIKDVDHDETPICQNTLKKVHKFERQKSFTGGLL